MPNGDGTKKGKKSLGLISKTQLCSCIALFIHIFFVVVFHDCKLPSYFFYGWNVVCAHKGFCCVFVFLFSSLPLIFTLLVVAFHIFLPGRYKNFILFLQRNTSPFVYLHCKMKRANSAPKMGPNRVSPERYCFGGQFIPIEMGLFWYQNLGLNWPLHRGQIRPWKGSIWKTLGPFWIFQ